MIEFFGIIALMLIIVPIAAAFIAIVLAVGMVVLSPLFALVGFLTSDGDDK